MNWKLFWPGVILFSLVFSFWLMWHTFSYNNKRSEMLISDKVWSDFAGHLPLIRSFSKGQNFPVENPTFPGEKIRYHFLFYQAVGGLEKIMPLDWAINLPSAFGLAGLLLVVAVLARIISHNFLVVILAMSFVMFNGSASALNFFQKHYVSELITLREYPAFGPWDGSDISASWNLNIFTNQRHLAPALALAIVIILNFLQNKRKLAMYLSLIFLPLLNMAIFVGLSIVMTGFWITAPNVKKSTIFTVFFALIGVLLTKLLVNSGNDVVFNPGFLMAKPISLVNFVGHLFRNYGLHVIFLPLGILLASNKWKRLGIALLPLFATAYLFQFSKDMFNNHKLLNLFLEIGVVYTALVVKHIHILFKPLVIFLLIVSGVFDFFPVINQRIMTFADTPLNKDVSYFESTPKTSLVLNSNWLFNPASIAGRKIFSGYTYFTWSHGYDSWGREAIQKKIYTAQNKTVACELLIKNKINFVELRDNPESFLQPNWLMWENEFKKSYFNSQTGVSAYDVFENCGS